MDHHPIIAAEANPQPQWDGEAAVVFATTVAEDHLATDGEAHMTEGEMTDEEEEAAAHMTAEIVGEVVVSSILIDGGSGAFTP